MKFDGTDDVDDTLLFAYILAALLCISSLLPGVRFGVCEAKDVVRFKILPVY